MLIFAILFCLGLLFIIDGDPVSKVLAARKWVETPCLITSSEVQSHSGGTYSAEIAYSYRVDGREYVSESYSTEEGQSSSGYDGKQALVDRYPPGTKTICYVNPQDPNNAVINRGYPESLLWGLVPLGFMAMTLRSLVLTIRGTPSQTAAGRMTKTGRRSSAILFAVVVVIGLAEIYPLLIQPVAQVVKAWWWMRAPCTILSSNLGSTSGVHPTYSAIIKYSYLAGGREYTSSRYGFSGATTNQFGWISSIVGGYRPGATAICYVDPANPSYAVINRGFTFGMLIGIVPIFCLLLGVPGFLASIKGGELGRL